MSARTLPLILATAGTIGLLLVSGAHWLVATLLPVIVAFAIAAREGAVRRRRERAVHARRAARRTARAQALEQSRLTDSLRAVLDRVDAPVLVSNELGEIVHANASSATLLAKRSDQLVNRTLADLFSQSALIACCESAIGGEPSRARVTLSILARSRTFDASAIPLQLDDAKRAVLTLRDVTDLATANRLKTDFVANASHELRTPVAAIKGSLETLEDAGDDPAMRERLISIIARNATRLEELLADLLELGRLESQEKQPPAERFEVEGLLRDVATTYEPRCQQRSLTLEIKVSEGARSVRLNRRLVEVVLSNLMDNATRFAGEGTVCTIDVHRISPPARADRASTSSIRFVVTDRGAGIPLADQSRIFERFYQVSQSRTKGDTGGTGLGLSIVKHAVQLLGGRVGIESVLHQGSTFWVEVPEDQSPECSLGLAGD